MTDATRVTAEESTEAQSRNWASCRLSIGFYMGDLMNTALSLCDNAVQKMAVRSVINLFAQNCKSEHEWRDAIEVLAELCNTHPEREQTSGGWHHGPASLLALAAAKEAATFGLHGLYPSLYPEGDAECRAFAAFRYILRAMAQKPEHAARGMNWLGDSLDLQPQR